MENIVLYLAIAGIVVVALSLLCLAALFALTLFITSRMSSLTSKRRKIIIASVMGAASSLTLLTWIGIFLALGI